MSNKREVLEKLAKHEIDKEEAEKLLAGPHTAKAEEAVKQECSRPDMPLFILVHGLVLSFFAYYVLFRAPKLLAMYSDMGVALPVITMTAFRVATLLHGIIVLAPVILITGIGNIFIYTIFSNRSQKAGRVYLWGSALCMVIAEAGFIFALNFPLRSLAEHLG